MRPLALIPALLVLLWAKSTTAQDVVERDDWAHLFADAGVTGTIVIVDERPEGGAYVHNPTRAARQFMPASTFKIPHALFVLDAGIVLDEFQRFPWDGTEHPIPGWNQDQDLRSSMRHSAVWLYQQFARKVGIDAERSYLRKTGYGNQHAGGDVDKFWIDGSLSISAFEQVAFLRRLYRNELPFDVADQRLVKDVLINEAGADWILRAKSGAGIRDPGHIGWWVGWVERPEGAVFFALNIEMPGGFKDASKRKSIARAILREIGALERAG